MQIQQIHAESVEALATALKDCDQASEANLALVFGSKELTGDPAVFETLRAASPHAVIAGCSTAGEITRQGIADHTLVVTLLSFRQANLCAATTDLQDMQDSLAAGRRLGEQLHAAHPDARALLVFGQGVRINGSALIDGLRQFYDDSVVITGGLAGDGGLFQETVVLTPAGPSTRAIVALALSGDSLHFAHGCFGGWQPFGPMRRITRAEGNVLYELGGKPALEVYKQYLGEYARDLPASGLLFPFKMFDAEQKSEGLIRTILGVDEASGSLTLAGDIYPDGFLMLMHASTENLVDGAETAAIGVRDMATAEGPGLAILVSCVGRKLVMGDRVDEEIEVVGEILGERSVLTGFYSYGEISPFNPGVACQLQNQTMTITWITETD